MLVQDTLTGAVHEVPESQLYEADYAESPEQMAEGQILYDGLGNPVGFSFLKRAFRAATRLAPLASLLPVPGAGLLTQVAQRALPGIIRQLARRHRGCNACFRQEWCSSLLLWRRHFSRRCRLQRHREPSEASTGRPFRRRQYLRNRCPRRRCRAGLATAAGMDSPSISLPGQEGSSYLFAMRFLAWSKGFGARGCRTGATCAGSRCPDAGARRRGARSHGTAICSPPPALVRRPQLAETSLCAGV